MLRLYLITCRDCSLSIRLPVSQAFDTIPLRSGRVFRKRHKPNAEAAVNPYIQNRILPCIGGKINMYTARNEVITSAGSR